MPLTGDLDPVVSIIVTAPTAGAQWQRGTTQTIQWTSSGSVGNVQIQLRDNSGRYSLIANSVANTGTYKWAIPANIAIGSGYQIRVSSVNQGDSVYDHSDSFSLTSSATDPSADYTNSLGMAFVWIPPGEYLRGTGERTSDLVHKFGGNEEWYKREQPQHHVTLSRGFYMMTTEVTQGQWRAVMGANPSYFKSGDSYPVEQVSWNAAQQFIDRLNAQGGAVRYRLPTEAEWEYSARAASTTRFCFGDDESRLGEYAWFDGNSGGRTQPVGGKKPNAWGLYDMHGNVWEWVSDWYGDYPSGSVTDPTGPSLGLNRAIRGGSWNYSPGYCRSTSRSWTTPCYAGLHLGFRLAAVQQR